MVQNQDCFRNTGTDSHLNNNNPLACYVRTQLIDSDNNKWKNGWTNGLIKYHLFKNDKYTVRLTQHREIERKTVKYA